MQNKRSGIFSRAQLDKQTKNKDIGTIDSTGEEGKKGRRQRKVRGSSNTP